MESLHHLLLKGAQGSLSCFLLPADVGSTLLRQFLPPSRSVPTGGKGPTRERSASRVKRSV